MKFKIAGCLALTLAAVGVVAAVCGLRKLSKTIDGMIYDQEDFGESL